MKSHSCQIDIFTSFDQYLTPVMIHFNQIQDKQVESYWQSLNFPFFVFSK